MPSLREAFGLGKKERGYLAETRKKLEEASINVISDDKLDGRISRGMELFKVLSEKVDGTDPIKKVDKLEEKLRKLTEIVGEISVAWCRAGDKGNDRISIALTGFERLNRLACAITNRVHFALADKKSLVGAQQLAFLLEEFLEVEIFPYIKLIYNKSFHSQDVSPSFAVVVQSPPQMGWSFSPGVAPTSGGRTSSQPLPSQEPMPPRMSNEVEGEDKE